MQTRMNGIHTLVVGEMEIDIGYTATPIGVTLDERVHVSGDGAPRTEDLYTAIPCWHTQEDIRDRIHRGHYEQRECF